MWFIKTSGFIGLVILILSIYFVATVSRLFLEMRPMIAMPPEVIARCEALLEQRDFKNIFAVVKEDNSFFSTALSTGIAELPNGLAEAREAMERVGESVTAEMEKKISMLAVLGTLGPDDRAAGNAEGDDVELRRDRPRRSTIASERSGQGDFRSVAADVRRRGLSVPAIYFFAVFRNRVSLISVNTMVRADEFLRHFAHAARSKAPMGAGPGGLRPRQRRPRLPGSNLNVQS